MSEQVISASESNLKNSTDSLSFTLGELKSHFSEYNPGNYLLKVIQKGKEIRTFKIIKD